MKHFNFSLLTFILLFGIKSFAAHDSIEFNHSSWNDILAQAKKENKMIYVDCFTTWCGPCKWMAKNIFTNDTVAEFYNTHFINAKIDMEKGEGIELAKKYNVKAYPTMLYLSPDGEQLHRTCGGAYAQQFIANGKNALDPEKQLATYTTIFNTSITSADFAITYFSMLKGACQSVTSEMEKYFSTQKESDLTSRNNWTIIYRYIDNSTSKQFMFLEANKDAFAKLYTSDSVDNKIEQVYVNELYASLRSKDSVKFESLKTKLLSAKTKNGEKTVQKVDIVNYKMKKNWEKFASASVLFIDKYAQKDAYELNNAAWDFYLNIDDKALLSKAADWSKRAVELENVYANNDTYAALLYKLGKKEEAKAAAERAIEVAKSKGQKYKETEDLLVKINEMK